MAGDRSLEGRGGTCVLCIAFGESHAEGQVNCGHERRGEASEPSEWEGHHAACASILGLPASYLEVLEEADEGHLLDDFEGTLAVQLIVAELVVTSPGGRRMG